MTPEQLAGTLSRCYPEPVTLRRQAKGPDGVGLAAPTMVNLDATVEGRVRPRGAGELTQNIRQGDRLVIVAAVDLIAKGWPVPPRVGDLVLIGDGKFSVEACKPVAISGEPALYRLDVRGG